MGIFAKTLSDNILTPAAMNRKSSVSRYEAPESEVLIVAIETAFLGGTNQAEVTVTVPEVEDSGYSYDF